MSDESNNDNSVAKAARCISGKVVDRSRFNAYRNGGYWIENEIITTACR